MKNYYEVDKGRFEAGLVRSDYSGDNIIAYTDGDEVITTNYYNSYIDWEAVTDFANYYGLQIRQAG